MRMQGAAIFLVAATTTAFQVPFSHQQRPSTHLTSTSAEEATATTYPQVDERTGKPTGISFLPDSTVELLPKGSPIEKVKLAKDGTSAFVDVYEYARKIREGEMTWEEVEAADIDTVGGYNFL